MHLILLQKLSSYQVGHQPQQTIQHPLEQVSHSWYSIISPPDSPECIQNAESWYQEHHPARAIIWRNKTYHDWIEREVSQNNEINDDDDDDDDAIENMKIQEFNNGQDKLRIAEDQYELKNFYRMICHLGSSFIPEASCSILKNIEQERESLLEQTNLALFCGIVIDKDPEPLMMCGIRKIK
jgi:hypothetical protein